MIEEKLNNDLAKEILTVISYCDNSFLNNIPSNIIKNLTNLAADSTKEYYIEKEKDLTEQNISEECKDFIAIMYFMYISDSKEKELLLEKWFKNEINIKMNKEV